MNVVCYYVFLVCISIGLQTGIMVAAPAAVLCRHVASMVG